MPPGRWLVFFERLRGRGSHRAHEFFRAVAEADVESVRMMIESGVDVDQPDSESACTPLGHAAFLGHVGIVRLLLQAGADPNKRSYDRPNLRRCTPLMEAAYSGHPEVVQMLLAAGADVHAKDASGETAMSQMPGAIAIRNSNSVSAEAYYEVVRLLRNAGAGGGPPDLLESVHPEQCPQVEPLLAELSNLAAETRHIDSGVPSFFFDPRNPALLTNAKAIAIGQELYRLAGCRITLMSVVADAIASIHGSLARHDLSAHWNGIGEAECAARGGEVWMH